MSENKQKNKLYDVETTQHQWDGIEELNNPLPRWWLWILYITIIWSIGYWVVYPAWPTLSGAGERGGTSGVIGWTQYQELKQQQAEIVALREKNLNRFSKASYEDILNDRALYEFALAGGKVAFKDNCATCHGTGGAGAKGYPNLNDDDWIWAGDFEGIYQTIKYGVRMHEDARDSLMPSYDGVLSNDEILNVSRYVQGLYTGNSKTYTNHIEDMSVEQTQALSSGARIYLENCAACHEPNGRGNRTLGAPNLADAIWLNSEDASISAISNQIKNPKHGIMPAWVDRLHENTLRKLTIYVHELGGGE
ncbi:MAG: cytochrome-c oxidase, cbb3-type subunit III [Pseudomonadota bacterium]